MTTTGLTVVPVATDHEVRDGDDLAEVLLTALDDHAITLRDGDVVAVASKVVAKAEGALVELPAAPDEDAARRVLAREHATRIVAESPWVLITETHHGLVCANGGIDASNVDEDGRALLLPVDPDRSAATLRAAITAARGVDVGILVTDTFGRPWRMGQTDVALGAAGIEVLRDDRGTHDRHGRVLGVTVVATADALAGAADLVRRKHDGVPFVLLRGADVGGDGRASDLVRPSREDLFPTGGWTTASAVIAAAGAAARTTPSTPPVPLDEPVTAAVRDAVAATSAGITLDVVADALHLTGPPVELGAARTAVCAIAAARGLHAVVEGRDDGLAIRFGRP